LEEGDFADAEEEEGDACTVPLVVGELDFSEEEPVARLLSLTDS
jgi:hypothetical protein